MKAIIRENGQRHRADTDTAVLVSVSTHGQFGDPDGYEERIYRNRRGFHFVHGIGGPTSPYPTERLRALTDEELASLA